MADNNRSTTTNNNTNELIIQLLNQVVDKLDIINNNIINGLNKMNDSINNGFDKIKNDMDIVLSKLNIDKFSISNITKLQWESVQKKLNIQERDVTYNNKPKVNLISSFKWDENKNEDKQMDNVINYLNGNFIIRGHVSKYLDISKLNNYLSVELAPGSIDARGTSDIQGIKKKDVNIIIQVKKTLSNDRKQFKNQSKIELMCASLKEKKAILHVLTDLDTKWELRWLGENSTIYCSCFNSPGDALNAMKSYFAKEDIFKSFPSVDFNSF